MWFSRALLEISETLWGERGKFRYLLIAAMVLLFTQLGARDIWTQEHRWADIVAGMFYRHDFLHPYLGEQSYYDKPLLSYWLIAFFAQLTGSLSVTSLRLPSALAGLLAIFAIYRLGAKLYTRQLGLLAGWLLLTTFYFLFWSRTSSADMLNMAGSLLAVMWYVEKRESPSFFNYTVFFLIIALTSLCKGLVGAVIPAIAVGVDLYLRKSWRVHVRPVLLVSMIPALLIYFIPFYASATFGAEDYAASGLNLVYRENILRFFKPFDHKEPLYTYFIYLPIYLFPWSLFFIPACYYAYKHFKRMRLESKWLFLVVVALFLFFTLSGSRRYYYVLPVVPFALLLTADQMLRLFQTTRVRFYMSCVGISTFFLLWTFVDLLPGWYDAHYGVSRFAHLLKQEATSQQAWHHWRVVSLDGMSKINFYLNLPPHTSFFEVAGKRDQQNSSSLLASWPILKEKPKNTIFITRAQYLPWLAPYFKDFECITVPPTILSKIFGDEAKKPVAFIPKQFNAAGSISSQA